MKLFTDVKTRLVIRMLCKLAKARGLELDNVIATLEEEWEKA